MANLIIGERLSYQEASEKSDIPIKKLRWIVHKKRQVGNINDKPGRAKLLDSTSEEKILKDCHIAATESKQVLSNEFKKRIKATIRNEFIETYKRRYGSIITEDYKKPCSKSVGRYLNEFSRKILETF